MPPQDNGETTNSSAEAPADPNELLAELRISELAVINTVAAFDSSLNVLSEAITTITAALADAQVARAQIAAEQAVALNAIQVSLEVALASIRAVNKNPVESDPFTKSGRLGGPQPLEY